ncbi:hypothetical protein GCM10007425_21350 [Lysinibacillus alkalisoli]|uniref:Uncharacterized protein n=1 Tax=Lysinibacillus alkalisoli TaxID=1911548 RepID=A0A917G7B9_9BACI|nr:hypothetical protein [Lysinibacillus alkalisoli]GGG26488.1 hypothetical protein GCM10007425_21350 [Lysinibacillus alkalisoli]
MRIDYLLLNESVRGSQISEIEISEKLTEFFIICDEIIQYEDENIFYSLEVYNQVFNGSDFVSWLYSSDEETTEKQLLRLYLEKELILNEELYENLYNSGNSDDVGGIILLEKPLKFNKHITPIDSSDSCLHIRKQILMKSSNAEDFVKGISKTFPNLFLSRNVFKSIKHFNPITKHADELIKHLSALNDYAMECYSIYKQRGHKAALQVFKAKSKGLECSPEGDAKRVTKFLSFEFVDVDGEVRKVECSPHTKLYQTNSDDRIYFEWNDERVNGRPPILIGHIGDHPYDKK